ncbi:MAG TPA: T9SS type A sorting domain-containing protein, partial [Anaerolineae bacterium]|nr:T9SS type A sorting domain-containing protein [Anaerolineae bacterium]
GIGVNNCCKPDSDTSIVDTVEAGNDKSNNGVGNDKDKDNAENNGLKLGQDKTDNVQAENNGLKLGQDKTDRGDSEDEEFVYELEVYDQAVDKIDAHEEFNEQQVNSITIVSFMQDGTKIKLSKTIREGYTIIISGFPYPFNYLNGAKLSFPEGSISEDITITIKLPACAGLDSEKEEVTFEGEIITAVTFEVSVDDEVICPYYFDKPLQLTLPCKNGLLDKLHFYITDLGMFYFSSTGELDDNGITEVFVDDLKNVITCHVAHFSEIAVAQKTVLTSVKDISEFTGYSLLQNYPNPFNPTTTIKYSIAISGNVKVDVYSMNGQLITTLLNEYQETGWHSVDWYAYSHAAGIYVYKINTGNFTQTGKMTLLK